MVFLPLPSLRSSSSLFFFSPAFVVLPIPGVWVQGILRADPGRRGSERSGLKKEGKGGKGKGVRERGESLVLTILGKVASPCRQHNFSYLHTYPAARLAAPRLHDEHALKN